MKKLNALPLIMCGALLNACSAGEDQTPPPVVITNEVPEALLSCPGNPVKPSFDTGSPKQDFDNIILYTVSLKQAGSECRTKLSKVRDLIVANQEKKEAPE